MLTGSFSGNTLDIVEATYTALVTGPAPLALDGAAIGGELPARSIPLPELEGLLLDRPGRPSAECETRDAIWRELITRARSGREAWVIGCFGVALPGLKRLAAQVTRPLDRHTADDVVSEIVTRFLEAVHTIDLEPRNVGPRLIWRAREAALYARMRHTRDIPTEPHQVLGDTEAAYAVGLDHDVTPVQALAEAVALGVITQHEADLITVTRLSTTSLSDLARKLEVPNKRLYSQRDRAEARLRAAIAEGHVPVTANGRVPNPAS
ncbi:hypothetical protein ACFVH6_23415 [Spirillospora sp. NPDC127200]